MPLDESSFPPCPNCRVKGKVILEIEAEFSLYFCRNCHNGFTFPVPEEMGEFYPKYYWSSSNTLGVIKDAIFSLFQRRRIAWLTTTVPKGVILDVGSGEGTFAAKLPDRYQAVSLEPPGSSINNPMVIKENFLKWKTGRKFDAICFWESLEHTGHPQKYLGQAFRLLNNHGHIFIEFPRYRCYESRLFGKHWFHLDTPRHLSHLTDEGVRILLKRSGFGKIRVKSIMSFEYAPWGFIASLSKTINPKTALTDNLKGSGKAVSPFLLAPFFLVACFIEILFLFLGESPIVLATAEKR